VQLGAFADPADALKAKTELTVALSGISRHTKRPLAIVASKRGGLARVVFTTAFSTPKAAATLCAALKARGVECFVTTAWLAPGRTRTGGVSPKPGAVGEAMAPSPGAHGFGALCRHKKTASCGADPPASPSVYGREKPAA
jgi:hypothetical protein